MAVQSSEDLASIVDDWGESFAIPGGATLKGIFEAPAVDALGMRGTLPHVEFIASAVSHLDEGCTITRVSTGKVYTVVGDEIDLSGHRRMYLREAYE